MLSIIAILGIIAILVFPKISGSNEVKKEREFEKIRIIVENAGKFYHSFNSEEYKVTVDKLKEEKYITSELINPETGKDIDGCVRVVKDSDGFLIYKYTSCDAVLVPFEVELNGGVTSQKFETKYYDSTTIELIKPTKENSDFRGWEVVKGNSILDGNKLIIGDTETILWAKWESWPELTVKLNGGSTSQVFKDAYKSGSSITLQEPTKVGYTFTGWKVISGNGLLSGNTFTMGSSNTTIEANYTINTYEITYNLNGGTLENKPSSGEYNEVITINNPSRVGYTFAGWTITGTGSTMNNTNLTVGYSNVELAAKWNANTYTINYYIGNGESTEGVTKLGTSTCKYDSTCALSSFTNLNGIFPYSSQDKTVNGKTNYSWVFYGWSETETGLTRKYENSESFTYQIDNNINLYAIGRKSISINSGIAPTTKLKTLYQYWNPYSTDTAYLSSVKLPKPTAITGWTFVGYKGGSNTANATVTFASSLVETNTIPNYNVYPTTRSVYKRTISIEYDANGGSGTVAKSSKTQYYNSGYGSSNKNVGETISTPTFTLAENKFTKEGYTFDKWEDESGTTYEEGASYTGFTPEVSSTDKVTTMKATWKINSYTITYNLNGGTVNGTNVTSLEYGKSTTLIVPTKTGYRFTGWTVSSGLISGNTFTMGNSNVTITANFVPLVVQAIYSETDNSLTFINDVLKVKGGTYNGKSVTEVYTGFTTTEYDETAVPWYSYRESIKKVEFIDEIKPTSLKNWFRGFSSCTEINLKKLNTSNVTSLYHTFDGMSSLTSLDVSHFNTTNVTNMSTVFKNCSKLTTLDLSNWNTAKVTVMNVMFSGMTKLTTLNISNFNTSNVTRMYEMFYDCSSLTTLDLSRFNTSNVKDMYSMFNGMKSLTTLSISNFNTSNVTSMNNMFFLCHNLSTLDLSHFNTSNVTDMYGMFRETGLNVTEAFSIKLGSNFNTNKVTRMQAMFNKAGYNAKTCSIDLGTSFNTSNVTNMYEMFRRTCSFSTTTTLNLGQNFDTSNVTNISYMFEKFARNNANFTLDLGDKFKFKDGVTVTSFASECGAGKLIIPETVTSIPSGTFKNMKMLKEIVFEHSSTNVITFPTAGSSTGAFYTSTALNTTITTTNDSVKNYPWASDNRTTTFK